MLVLHIELSKATPWSLLQRQLVLQLAFKIASISRIPSLYIGSQEGGRWVPGGDVGGY